MYFSSVTSSQLLVYDTSSWDLKICHQCNDDTLRDISWSDDSKYILKVNSRGVEILTAANDDIESFQHIPVKDLCSATFRRVGHENVAIGTENGYVMIWDTKNKSIRKTFPPPSQKSNVTFMSYNAENTSLATTMQNGDTVIYGVESNIPELTVEVSYSKNISSMKFHHEARSYLGLATDEGHVLVRDIITNGNVVCYENIHASSVSDIDFDLTNTDVMLSCGHDNIMNVYDVKLQNVVSRVQTQYVLTSLAINSENQIALGTKNGLVLVYDLRNLTSPSNVVIGQREEIIRVSFQPVGKKLQSAEISLQEDSQTNMLHLENETSLVHTRVSDSSSDSYLVMMELPDKEFHYVENFNSPEPERKIDQQDDIFQQLEAQNASTPVKINTDEYWSPSPVNK